jgi:hypothetical protein
LPKLQLWNDYTREDVHSIFSPTTTFTPQAGTWGLQGMIRIPDRRGDWVFFVTYGQVQGDHTFDESITEEGVLSWQSQPALGFGDEAIKELIRHDANINNVYLFLRTAPRAPYSYLGRLGYVTHDAYRERPVYFQWQILDWPPPVQLLERIQLKLLRSENERPKIAASGILQGLLFVDAPTGRLQQQGVATLEFKQRKAPDYAESDAKNHKLGLEGEHLVLNYEIDRLKNAGQESLALQVTHVSISEGDTAGYDIRSFELDGKPRYIEVKTTKGDANTRFFLSANEVAFSAQNAGSYFLYRLFEFDPVAKSAKSFILAGAISEQVILTPTIYRAEVSRK